MNCRFPLSLCRIVAFCTLAATWQANAQEWKLPPAVLGLGASYNYGFGVALEGDLANGTYNNHLVMQQATLYLIFPKIFGNGAGISSTIGYGEYALWADGTNPRVISDGNSTFTNVETLINYSLTMKAVEMDLMFYGQIGDIARIEFGPWGSFGFLPQYTMTESLLTPGVTFSDGTRIRGEVGAEQSGFIVNTGIGLRTSLEIPLPLGMAFLPSAQARAAVTFPQGDSRKIGVIGTVGVGATLLFGQPNGIEIPAPPPSPPSSALDTLIRVDTVTVPTASTIRAAVDLYSQDAHGQRTDTLLLAPTQTLHRVEVPMMTTLHFEKNSASLPARYGDLTPSTRDDFSLDVLIGASPMELHRQRLNVIGLRMQENPSSTLTINGSSATDEPRWFAESRAKAVKQYLTETWGIASARITAKGINEHHGTQVELTSRSSTLLGPITAEWIDQEIDAAPIGVEPQFASARGIRSWRIAVTQNGREIGVVRNTDAPGTASIDASMIVRNASNGTGLPALNAELVVEDSSGTVTIVRDEMPIIASVDVPAGTDLRQAVSTFALFDSSHAALAPVLSHIADVATDSAEITIRAASTGATSSDYLRYINDQLQSELAGRGKSATQITIERPESNGSGEHDGTMAILVAVSERR